MTMSDAKSVPISALFAAKSRFSTRTSVVEAAAIMPAQEDLYQKGLHEGQSLGEACFAIERERLEQLIASASALKHDENAEIVALLNQIILTIVRQVVGEVAHNSELMARQIEAAATLLIEAEQARSIYLNPDDFALLKHVKLPLPCKADPNIPLGGIRIECSAGWIEHGPAYTMQRIAEALDTGAAG